MPAGILVSGYRGTGGFDQTGWQKAGWHNTDTLARRPGNFWLGTSLWWAHWKFRICRHLLGLPAPQQTSLPVVKRQNIRASPTRIFSANRSGIPRCVQCKCPLRSHHFGRTLDWYLRRLAWDVIFIPKTLGHCTAFQFGLNTQELCFRWWRTGPLAIQTFDFSIALAYVLSPLDLYYRRQNKKNYDNNNNNNNNNNDNQCCVGIKD